MDNIVKKRIQESEQKDRFIGQCVLEQIFKDRKLDINETDTFCSVDLKCTALNKKDKRIKFNVEIKERYKSQENIIKYPYAELRVDKLDRMKQETGKKTALLYMVLLNDTTMYLFNLSKLDWSKVGIYNWRIKACQSDQNSPYTYKPIYQIPYNMAFKKMDITEYVNAYNKQKDSKENSGK